MYGLPEFNPNMFQYQTPELTGTRRPSVLNPQQAQTQIDPRMAGYTQMREQVQRGSDFAPDLTRLQSLLTNPASIQKDPSYQFRLDEGNQAINRSAAAKGILGSGNVLAQLAKYGQGMASEEYGNQFSRLSDLLRQKQNFGLNAGYFDEPTRTTQGWEGGALVTRRDETPTYW